jgi:site-specific DNA-methyltransferase (adenine-specific)
VKPYHQEAGITIYHGDCREILPTLGPVDLVLTDPPYGIGWSRSVNHRRASKAHDGILGDSDTTARDEALEILRDTMAIVFGSFYAPFPDRLKQVLVWQKPADSGVVGSTTGYRRDAEPIFLTGEWPLRTVRASSVLRTDRGISAITTETGHPHTKPIGLVRQLIGCTDARTILDPFMGSGTTLRAAKDLGRQAIGIEIEERYCEIAVKRLSQGVLAL